MKKKITSKKELNSMALSSGAMVTDASGKKFNSKKTTAHKKPPEPKPEPPPKRLEKSEPKAKPAYVPPVVKPKPTEPDKGSLIIAQKMDDMSKTNAVLMASLMQEVSKISFSAAMPVMEWNFEFTRDTKGYLTGIHAKAVESKMVLN